MCKLDKIDVLNKLKNFWHNTGEETDAGMPFIALHEIIYCLGLTKNDHSATVFNMAEDQPGFIGSLVRHGIAERVYGLKGILGYRVMSYYSSLFNKE